MELTALLLSVIVFTFLSHANVAADDVGIAKAAHRMLKGSLNGESATDEPPSPLCEGFNLDQCIISGDRKTVEPECLEESSSHACGEESWSAEVAWTFYHKSSQETEVAYLVTQVGDEPGVIHVTSAWSGNCCARDASSFAGAAEPWSDPATCSFGIKFDTRFNQKRRQAIYIIRYAGNVPLVEGAGSIVVEASSGYCEIKIDGPDCSSCDHIASASGSSSSSSTASTVSGKVTEDINRDNIGEDGISGVPMILCHKAYESICTQTATDSQGRFSFTNLAPGEYCVIQTNVGDYIDVGDSIDGNGDEMEGYQVDDPNKICIKVERGKDIVALEFIDELPSAEPSTAPSPAPTPLGIISGSVLEDADQSGDFSDADVGIPSVWVAARGPVWKITKTDSSGAYSFHDLRAGRYTILEAAVPGFKNMKSVLVDLSAGVTVGDINFLESKQGGLQ